MSSCLTFAIALFNFLCSAYGGIIVDYLRPGKLVHGLLFRYLFDQAHRNDVFH